LSAAAWIETRQKKLDNRAGNRQISVRREPDSDKPAQLDWRNGHCRKLERMMAPLLHLNVLS